MADENYHDQDGNPITLEALVRSEPEWAVNVIRMLRENLANAEAEVTRLDGRRRESRQLLRRLVRRIRRGGAPEPLTHLADDVANYLSRTTEPQDILRLQGSEP